MTTPAKVFIIDDDPAVRDALALMLEQEGLQVDQYDSAEAFLAGGLEECCGCAIVDIRMQGMDGLQLQQELNRRGAVLPIIFLTGHGSIPMSVNAIKAGAVDFLTKPVSRAQLLAAVHSAIQIDEQLLAQAAHNHEAQSRLAALTRREREVLDLAIAGHPNKEIARQLGISHRTVEIHKSRIMHKSGASNLLDLTRIAQEAGLLGH